MPSALLTNLTGAWELNEASGNALDAHNAGPYDLTDNATVTTGTGFTGGSRHFTRANGEFFNNASVPHPTSTQDWSFAVFVKVANHSDYASILGQGNTGNQKQYILIEQTTGKLFRWTGFDSGTVISTGVWTHIAYTYASGGTNTGTEKFYVDGVNVATRTGAVPAPNALNFDLGCAAAGSFFFDGDMAQARYYVGRCLSSSDVSELYAAGLGLSYPFAASPRTIPATASLSSLGLTRTVPSTSSLNLPGLSRTVSASASLGLGRGVPVTTSLSGLRSRTIPLTASTTRTTGRTIPTTVSLSGGQRPVPATGALWATAVRSVPSSAAISRLVSVAADLSFGVNLFGTAHAAYVGRSAQQLLHIVDSDGGTWTVTFDSQTTPALAYNLSASTLQAALQALSSIGVGNVTVLGGPGGVKPFLVLFAGALANTPVGLLLTNSSLLTGPAGLDPRATVRSLSPGYSADDDYGLLDETTVSFYTENGGLFTTGTILDLSFQKADVGGDQTASGTLVLTPPYDGLVPEVGQVVLIADKRGAIWGGLLETPAGEVDAGQARLSLSARGFFTVAQDLPFATSRTFLAGTSVGSIVQAVRNELMGRYFSPLNGAIVAGKSIFEPTPDLYKRNASAVISDYAALGDVDDTPLVYGARISRSAGEPINVPVLYLEREAPPTVYRYRVYLKDGVKVRPSWDASEIVNRYYVEYENDTQRGLASVDYLAVVPTGETVSRLRAQFAEGSGATNLAEAASYGAGLVKRHGAYTTAGCTITIPGGCPVYDEATGHVLPASRMEPNQRVNVADWPTGFPPIDWRITTMRWQRQNGEVTLQTGRAGDARREIRRLAQREVFQATQPGDAKLPYVTPQPDRPTVPWVPIKNSPADLGGGGGGAPNSYVVPLAQTAADVLVTEQLYVLPTSVDEGCAIIPWNARILRVVGLSPVGQDSAAVEVVISHSTLAAYGSRTNLASLVFSGVNSTPQKTIEQALAAGDVLYFTWATPPPQPPDGYQFVTLGITLERTP